MTAQAMLQAIVSVRPSSAYTQELEKHRRPESRTDRGERVAPAPALRSLGLVVAFATSGGVLSIAPVVLLSPRSGLFDLPRRSAGVPPLVEKDGANDSHRDGQDCAEQPEEL